mgnify:FL=1
MSLTLHRIYLPAATLGLLEAFGETFWTMEPIPGPVVGSHCVPEAEYVLEPHDGARFKGTFALVGEGVSHWATPGVDDETILFHVGNKPDETHGCILIGTGVIPRGPLLLGSRQAFETFRVLMREQSGARTLRIQRG